MSGICGIVNVDGAPIDRKLLDEMTAFMAYRGPDAQAVWIDGSVGFGHTMLCTDADSRPERQPCSLDGEIWITADARIDGQRELKARLEAKGRRGLRDATDPELILHAYQAWGQDCLGHLIGDFAFAIWDRPRKQLFCARDHFGVKPFFYAAVGQCLVFSNTLNCVRRHPAVSPRLNDLAIADFLLFEMNQDPESSAFAEIRRLPPAWSLTRSVDRLNARRYWSIPMDLQVQYRDGNDYVERFKELLGTSVAERLRTSRVAIMMSGGLDSPAIAATVQAQISRQSQSHELGAYTSVYDCLIPDEERRFSSMVAEKLGIPIRHRAADGYQLFGRYEQMASYFPEPANDPLAALEVDLARDAASGVRVALTGWDGDTLLNESPRPFFRSLLKEWRFGRLLSSSIRYALSERKRLPRTLLRAMNPWARRGAGREGYRPPWLNEDFAKQWHLRERWAQVARAKPLAPHPIRPHAYRVFDYLARLSSFFEGSDAGRSRIALEYRHPFMDLRLVTFCLSLPVFPWCMRKELLRRSLTGILPEHVRLRPKTPLAGFPHLELLGQKEAQWIDRFVISEDAARYIDRDRIPPVCGDSDPDRSWANLRPVSLDLWLRNVIAH